MMNFVYWIEFYSEGSTTKILGSKKHNISFCHCRCFNLLFWIGIKCMPNLLSLSRQELCSEYRKFVRNGKLPCTRENDPIQGPDGKMHGNTCSMCEAFLWVALQLGKWERVFFFLLHFFFFFELYCILFLQLHLCLVNDFFKHIFAQFYNYQRIILAY